MLKEPKKVEVYEETIEKKIIGKELKKDGSNLIRLIENLENDDKKALCDYFADENNKEKEYVIDDKTLILKSEWIKFSHKTVNVIEEKFIPNVIEPAFGIGRIISCILEHNFKMRDEKRTYLLLPPRIAPIKVSILPVIKHSKYENYIN